MELLPSLMPFHLANTAVHRWIEEFNSAYRRNFNMKQILSLLAIGILGAWTAAAQTSASGQAGASAQSQNAAQANKSGAQASGSGSESTSANANAGNNSASISSGTNIDATLPVLLTRNAVRLAIR